MIVKTEAIVLKKLNFGDTSRIITLFAKDYGRLSVLAKGVRDPKSKFGPVLDTFNHLQVVVYKKEGRDLHLLSQCDLLTRFDGLTRDLNQLGCAMAVLDLVSATSHYDEEGAVLFAALLETLKAIDAAGDTQGPMLYFQTRLLFLLGFQPDLTCCITCKLPVDPVDSGTKNRIFRLTGDGILCHRCRLTGMFLMEVRSETLSLLRVFQHMLSGWRSVDGFSVETHLEAKIVLSHLLRNHVEGVRNLKSGSVLASIMEQ